MPVFMAKPQTVGKPAKPGSKTTKPESDSLPKVEWKNKCKVDYCYDPPGQPIRQQTVGNEH